MRVRATFPGGPPLTETVRTKGYNFAHSVAVEVILASVHVTDDRGRFVEGLQQPQFKVLEDGVPQDVTSFLPENAAASLLLALDISGSMSPAVGELKSATSQFLKSLRPADRVTLTGFSNSLFVLAPATADAAARQAALEQLHPAGGTALYDSMIRGVEPSSRNPVRAPWWSLLTATTTRVWRRSTEYDRPCSRTTSCCTSSPRAGRTTTKRSART